MKYWKFTIIFLLLVLSGFLVAIYQIPDNNLHIIACDVGQGDAILVTYKNIQIVTDGGIPNGKLVSCLSKHIPFWDREIEVVVNTHPQLDHYGGFIEMFKKYKVDNFIGNGLIASASEYQVLEKEVGSSGTKVVNPVHGMVVRSGLISYDIFWPSADFLRSEGYDFNQGKLGTFTSKRDPNDFSVQAILSFGKFNGLLTGDIGHNVADMVIPELPAQNVNYIKVPHHGSKYGMTPDYLKQFVPEIAVISVGAKNRYGHPAPETLDILANYGIKTLRTDKMGDIEVVTDGDKFWIKN